METLKKIWSGWLDLMYGKKRCKYGVRMGAHEYFNMGCEGCRSDMLKQWDKEEAAALERLSEERIEERVEALRRFHARHGSLYGR